MIPRIDLRPARLRSTAVVSVLVALVASCAGVAAPHGSAEPTASPATDPSALPSAGSPGPAASRTAGPTVDVPAAIDPTAGTDVTGALQAVIDRAPDGATIRLPSGARYRLGGTLHLDGRHDLALDGRGTTFQAGPGDGPAQPLIVLVGSSGITIRDLRLLGASLHPGVYEPAREHDHGISIVGGGAISLTGLTIERTTGDCVYVADRSGGWADGVNLLDSSCSGPGRNGVAVVGGRNIDIERTTFSNIGYHVLDLEPNQGPPVEGAANVTFWANRVNAPVAGDFVAANGWGPVDHLTVSDNDLHGLTMRVEIVPKAGSGYRRSFVSIVGNRSDTTGVQADPVMLFDSVDDLAISANVQPLAGIAILAEISHSCRLTIANNEIGSGRAFLASAPAC